MSVAILPMNRPAPPPRIIDRPLTFTVFPNQYAKTKAQRAVSLIRLGAVIAETRAKQKTDLPFLKGAVFGDYRTEKGCLRNNTNVIALEAIMIDIDGKLGWAAGRALIAGAGLAALMYTTPSHTD